MDEREDTVGRLLEGTTEFSRAERAEIFDDVFAAVSAEEQTDAAAEASARPRWITWFAWAAVIALAIVPASYVLEREPEFTARGEPGSLELQCSGSAGCMVGDALTFEIDAAPMPWFAAFARDDRGTVVWYFPERPDGRSAQVRDGLLDRSVTLGDEHHPGVWTVYALFSAEPLDRDAIRAHFDDRGELVGDDVKLFRRTLTIR